MQRFIVRSFLHQETTILKFIEIYFIYVSIPIVCTVNLDLRHYAGFSQIRSHFCPTPNLQDKIGEKCINFQ